MANKLNENPEGRWKTTIIRDYIPEKEENTFYTKDYDLIKQKSILVRGEHWLRIKFLYF